jgi:non-ribosomal peptide synthetase-like protein
MEGSHDLQTLVAIFQQTVTHYPEHVALEFGSRQTTYRELDTISTQLAQELFRLGVTSGQCVALYHERSDRCLIALLAILKTGCAYVPIDPATPIERVRQILNDCQAVALISDSPAKRSAMDFSLPIFWSDMWTGPTVSSPILPEIQSHDKIQPHDLAYLIYTSGSTGQPKGVMLEHRSVCHYVSLQKELYGITPQDRVFQGFSLAFDASVEEIWLAWAHGATLVVASAELIQKGPDLGFALEQLQISVFSTVPTLLSVLEGELKGVRILILGGEACPAALVQRWASPTRRMFNTYGPTETTVIATAKRCDPHQPVTIGRPLRGYEVLLVDDNGRKIASSQIGVVGEIWIGGIAVARGYLNRPELTAEKFVEASFTEGTPSQRYYRTGDLGSWTASGELEFRGRIDQQIKIRGFRVELEEVEATLQNFSKVQTAAAKVFTDPQSGPYLVGYVTVREGESLTETELREHLRRWLPPYMIPNRYIVLDKFPLLPSGKIDRNRLLEPVRETMSDSKPIEWANETQKILAECWSRVLGVPVLRGDQNFFHDLGGHSLLVAQVVSELRKIPRFSTLSVADVYHHPTIESLASAVESAAQTTSRPLPLPPRKPISRARHFLCGCGQMIALYPLLGFFSLQWMLPYLVYSDLMFSGAETFVAIGVALLSLLGVFPLMLLLSIVCKWVLIGRFQAGRYPLWGGMYFRFWVVRTVCNMAPTSFLVGTPLLSWYYRCMGARIGKNVYLGSDDLTCFDLIEIGDHSTIGYSTGLLGYTVRGGELHLGKIRIGERVFVGNRSMLGIQSSIENGSALEDLSLLPEGQTIPAGERWLGSPAQKKGAYSPPPIHSPSWANRWIMNSLYALGSALLPLVAIVAYFPGVLFLSDQARHSTGYAYLWYAPLVALSFVVIFTLLVTATKWLLLGRVKAGTYSRHGFFALRRWFVNGLMDLSLDVTGTLYATIYLNPWYRALGVKVGKRAEISTADSIPFDLLELGPESFVADAVTIGAARIEGDTVTLDRVTLGSKAFAGNGAVIPHGRTLGADGLLGCQSLAPPEASVPDSSWVGSPAVFLPVRQVSLNFSEAQISKPPFRLWLLRGAIEAVRILLPPTVLVVLSSFLILSVMLLREVLSIVEILALFPLIYGTAGLLIVLFTVALKWLIVGRWYPTQQPLWSHFVWRTELISGLREHLADRYLTSLLVGTPLLCWYYRLFGAQIGQRVFLDTNDLCEFDLTVIGNEAEINEWVTLQTHLFEDRVIKVSWVKVGERASIGARTLILYDTQIEPEAQVGELSLIMKGEAIPAGYRWVGIPVRMND